MLEAFVDLWKQAQNLCYVYQSATQSTYVRAVGVGTGGQDFDNQLTLSQPGGGADKLSMPTKLLLGL